MSHPPYYLHNYTDPYTGQYPHVQSPVQYFPPPAAQYGQPAGTTAPHQISCGGYGQPSATAQAPYAPINSHYQAIQQYASPAVQQNQVQISYSPPSPTTGYQYIPYQEHGVSVPPKREVQQYAPTPPMPSTTWSPARVGMQQSQHVKPAPARLPKLFPIKHRDFSARPSGIIEKKFTDYRSLPSKASSTPPRPMTPEEIIKVHHGQANPQPPRRKIISPNTFSNNMPEFARTTTMSVMGAFDAAQNAQTVKSEPVISLAKDVLAALSVVGGSQVQMKTAMSNSPSSVSTAQQKPALDVIKYQMAAARKRIEEVTSRNKESVSSLDQTAKVKMESGDSDAASRSSDVKKTLAAMPISASKVEPAQKQRGKENVRPNSAPLVSKVVICTPVTTLSNGPKDTAISDSQLNAKPPGNGATSAQPSTSKAKTPKVSTQSNVVLLRPGKIVVEARKLSGSGNSQLAKPVGRSTPSNLAPENDEVDLYGPPDALGLRYLKSASSDYQPGWKSRPVQDAVSRGDFATYRNGGVVKPEPSLVPPRKSSAGSASSFRRPTASSVSTKVAKPAAKVEPYPAIPRNSRRHFTAPHRGVAPEVDPDLVDFLAATTNAEPYSDDPDMEDFLAATTVPPKEIPIKTDVSQPKKESSLGRFFKKSVVATSKVKPSKSKIQIASVKMRPGFEAAEPPTAVQDGEMDDAWNPQSPMEDGQIESDGSFLPYDYTSMDKPKVPRPSVVRTTMQPDRNGSLPNNEPVPKRKRSSSGTALRSPPTFLSSAKESIGSGGQSSSNLSSDPVPRLDVPSSPPLAGKASLSSDAPFMPSYDISSDLDMDDMIVVDCSVRVKRESSKSNRPNKEMIASPPRKKRLVRRSNTKPTPVRDLADNNSHEDSENSIVPARSTRNRQISVQGKKSADSGIRYATGEEMKSLVSSIEEAQYEARSEASYDKPDSFEECTAESNWQPYKCFVCAQKWAQNAEITKHLEIRHSIILPRKFKAWQCFFPECPKSFCDRSGALGHAKGHFAKR